MMRNVALNSVSHVHWILHSDIWAQFSCYPESRLGPIKLKRQFTRTHGKHFRITDCFLSLCFVVSLPCLLALQRFSCRKTSGYLGKCVHLGGFVHAMSSTAAGAGADTELLQPLITGLEKLNLTLQWRDNLCHLNNLILHCFHCRDWDKSFHGAEQLCACLSEIRNAPSFPRLVSPALQLYLLIH